MVVQQCLQSGLCHVTTYNLARVGSLLQVPLCEKPYSTTARHGRLSRATAMHGRLRCAIARHIRLSSGSTRHRRLSTAAAARGAES